jgi:hypothetical protein
MQESSLRQTTRTVRKYILFFVILIIVIIVLQLILNALPQNVDLGTGGTNGTGTDLASLAQLYQTPAQNLEPLVPPDLENIPLSESSDPLFNVVDMLPEIPFTSVNVYKVEEPRERFGSEDIAKDIAENFGFNDGSNDSFSRNTANTELTWQDETGSKQLTYSKTTFEWTFKSKFPQSSAPKKIDLENEGLENTEESITAYHKDIANSIVEDLAMNRKQIDFDLTQIDYLEKEGGQYINASSPSTAEYIKAKLYRSFDAISLKTSKNPTENISQEGDSADSQESHSADSQEGDFADSQESHTNKTTLQEILNLDENAENAQSAENAENTENYQTPIIAKTVSMDYLSAPMELIFKAGFKDQISLDSLVYFNFKDWKFEDGADQATAYRLISPQAAWEKVKQRKGGIRLLSDNRLDNAYKYGTTPDQNVISFNAENNSFELAYLEPANWTGYIYPIYIFRGQAKLASSGEEDSADFVIYVYAYEPTKSNESHENHGE